MTNIIAPETTQPLQCNNIVCELCRSVSVWLVLGKHCCLGLNHYVTSVTPITKFKLAHTDTLEIVQRLCFMHCGDMKNTGFNTGELWLEEETLRVSPENLQAGLNYLSNLRYVKQLHHINGARGRHWTTK